MSEEKLTAAQVRAVYEEVLGRKPDDSEVESQMGQPDLAAMLRLALDSAEYQEQLRLKAAASAGPSFVNVHHPDLAAYGLPPGTRSDDEIGIVGDDGFLFLFRGTNTNVEQHIGAIEMAPGWLDEWRQIILRRQAECEEMGLATATLVVPDKLAVYEELYPEPLVKVGPRPVERVLALPELGLIYPIEEMRRAAQDREVFMRNDTHLTFPGNELLFRTVLEPLGIGPEALPDFASMPLRSYPVIGDLGVKFDPRIVTIVHEPNTLGAAEIVEDNRAEIEAVGGHIGTRRVFRNRTAPDRRVAVLFGDSFGFSAAYYQGVSWFMAQVFSEVHFIWIPFGWDPDYVRAVGAEVVLVQGAERFVARIPHPRTEVAQLAEETLRRKAALGFEAVFD
jgi:alginate O-acetyltransferase complex protein AlgJ